MTMATLTADALPIGLSEVGSDGGRATGRTLDPSVLATLSGRSDIRGAVRFGTHLGCMAVTGVLVWLAMPNWHLLIPAMVLHGLMIVSMFPPMHASLHRPAFAS